MLEPSNTINIKIILCLDKTLEIRPYLSETAGPAGYNMTTVQVGSKSTILADGPVWLGLQNVFIYLAGPICY